MDYNYPYPHETVGMHIVGKPAEQIRQTIKGLGAAVGLTPAQLARAQARALRQQYRDSVRVNKLAWKLDPVGQKLKGLGAVQTLRYPNGGYNPNYGWQYNSGIPYAYYLLLLQQQQSRSGYGLYPYGPYQPQYQYQPYQYNQQQQYYYVPYSQCVGGGGLWDSFANACTSSSSSAPPYQQYPPYQTYGEYGGYGYQTPRPMPSVVGLSMASGVNALNQAGYTVWLISQDGIPQGTPPGYVQNRAVITVNNGIITGLYQG